MPDVNECQEFPAIRPEDVKQVEELIALGGKFYTMGNESWCDTELYSWKLIHRVGTSRWTDDRD